MEKAQAKVLAEAAHVLSALPVNTTSNEADLVQVAGGFTREAVAGTPA